MVALLCGALVLVATRNDPQLSPDSITYLSAAEHLRNGAGLSDFTGAPLTVFGPIYPILLSPGGRSLMWASLIGALAVAAATFLMFLLLRGRVRPWVALVGAAALGTSQGMMRVASTALSEAPYAAVALATMVVLVGGSAGDSASNRAGGTTLTVRRSAVGGLLAGIGFLTRYAGAGLIATGAVMVAAAPQHGERRPRWRALCAYGGAAVITSATWIVRNLIRTGQPLGPRFEGGTTEALGTLLRRPLPAIGKLLVDGIGAETAKWVGFAVVVALVVFTVLVVVHRPRRLADVGVATFALTSLVVPVLARAVTANDIELRVMSPMLIPVIYIAAVTVDRALSWASGRFGRRMVVYGLGLALVLPWAYQGVMQARDLPRTLPYGAGSRTQYSPQLYDIVEALPADVNILTNSPQRVWWQTRHEPTLFAFTRPRPGNSHYPLSVDETVRYACAGTTYLAWFGQLLNAGDSPQERRPDLLEVVDLTVQRSVPGGQLYVVTPRSEDLCGG